MLLEYSKELRAKGDGTTVIKHDLQVALCQAYQLQQQRDMALVVIQVSLALTVFDIIILKLLIKKYQEKTHKIKILQKKSSIKH